MIIIPAFANSTNVEELTIRDANGQLVDFAAIGAVSARIFAGGDFVDCSLGIDGKLSFVPGDLQISTMDHPAVLRIYSAGDTKGKVFAGPGLPTSISVRMVA